VEVIHSCGGACAKLPQRQNQFSERQTDF
jgi:hypothetical protein